jgi:hypothetical protein
MDEEEHIIFIPAEDREIIIPAEEREIEIAAEIRELEVTTMLQASKAHTAGNNVRWKVNYDSWLDNAVEIQTMNITSSSATLTIGQIQVLGRHIYFFLTGGNVNEQATITLTMIDTINEKKVDTLQITVVTP